MIRLARPDVRFHRSYLAAHDEFAGAPRDGDGVWVEAPDGRGYAGTDFSRAEMDTAEGFARYVAWRLDSALEDSPRTHGHVPCTYFWVVDDAEPDTYLGTASIRHRLTPFLHELGGHVGYSVRPSARRRGRRDAGAAPPPPPRRRPRDRPGPRHVRRRQRRLGEGHRGQRRCARGRPRGKEALLGAQRPLSPRLDLRWRDERLRRPHGSRPRRHPPRRP